MIDIYGDWVQQGSALNPDGSELYAWSAEVGIARDGDGARVTLATATSNSRSVSRSAVLSALPDGRVALLYDYIADPTHEATAGHDFFGMTRIVFDADASRGEGRYLNYNGRHTFGRLTLTRA